MLSPTIRSVPPAPDHRVSFGHPGGRFISVNPVRTGYSAIADEWVPIRPGTDGALLLALTHEIVSTGLYDRAFLARYTNAGYLIDVDPASDTSHRSSVRKVDESAVNVSQSAGGASSLKTLASIVFGPVRRNCDTSIFEICFQFRVEAV